MIVRRIIPFFSSEIACSHSPLTMPDNNDTDLAHKSKDKRIGSGVDATPAQFSARFFAAVRQRDAKKIREMAAEAGSNRWEDAARPLCDFLLPPSRRWKTPRNRKRGWSEARATAVWALAQIEDPVSHRALARTLATDPDFMVREAARAAIQKLGAAATPSLVEVVRDQVDWDLDGMRAVLTCVAEPEDLSDSARRAVGILLTDVLFDSLPHAPARWVRPARKLGQSVFTLVLIATTFALLQDNWSFFLALPLCWVPAQLAGLITRWLTSMLYGAARSRSERKHLYGVAADSLVRLNDKRAIPGMLQLAFDMPRRSAGRYSGSVLLSLLPQLTEQDSSLFSAMHIELLNGAVTQNLGPALTVAILHALGAVGNGSSIRRVQRVARRGKWDEVRAKAATVLQVLEAREARLKVAQSLLRGAQAPTSVPTEMLRAAMPQTEQRAEQLLRPIDD